MYQELTWSNANAIPAIGSTVTATINDLGDCRVTGYFAQDQYVGLLVEVLDPPQWFTRKNGNDKTGHLFGAEVRLREPAPADPNRDDKGTWIGPVSGWGP